MNPRPEQQQFGNFGSQPVAPTGAQRLWPLVRALTTRTIMVAGCLALWQLAAPERFQPATLFGEFAGAIVTHEVNSSVGAQVGMQRRLAELNVEMQMRIFKAQTLMQQQLESLAGQQTMTQVADIGCVGGTLIGAIAHAFNYGDWEANAGKVAKGSCGVAQAAHIQLTSAQQSIMQGDLTMQAAGFDRHQYSGKDSETMAAYMQTLPESDQQRMITGLDLEKPAVANIIMDRLLIHYRQHRS